MTVGQGILLFCAAVISGALNSVAGGGGFIAFPALIFTGVPLIAANATSATALVVGNLASLSAYRSDLIRQRAVIIVLLLSSLIGGTIGGVLLVITSPVTFVHILPWLLLVATALFAASGPVAHYLRRNEKLDAPVPAKRLALTAVAQVGSAIYGGYYGGGNGFVMLALLSLMGMTNIHKINALRTLMAITLNTTAIIIFIVAGKVYWPQALLMMVGAVLGGYFGAFYARQVNPAVVRGMVIVIGVILTIYFFVKQ